MANPEWTDPSDFNPRPTRAQLGIDGNCGFALLGDNLQEGEAEFEEIKGFVSYDKKTGSCWFDNAEAKKAINRAYRHLKERIDYPISYYLTDSYPGAS